MKNKLSLFIVGVFAILSGCSLLGDRELGIVNKKRSQRELDRIQAAKQERERLKNGNWQSIDDSQVGVRSTNDDLGYEYKKSGLTIKNRSKFAQPIPRTFGLDFGRIFQKSDGHEISDDTEINARKTALEQFKLKDKVGDLTPAQKDIIKMLKPDANDNTKFNEVFDSVEKYNILLELLKKGKAGVLGNRLGKVKKEYIEKNKLEQYRRKLGLKYSDFGVWNTSFDLSKLDENWKKVIENSGVANSKYEYFAIGDSKHKVNFVIDHEKDLTFTGKTVASVSKGGAIQGFGGNVELSVLKGQATGKFDLSFYGWYKFSLDKLKLDDFTAAAGSNWTVSGDSMDSKWKFKDAATKNINNFTMKSAFFGDNGKSEEIVGTYKFTAENAGDNFTINGAFGAKKK